MRDGQRICIACGTTTRANLPACPQCGGELQEVHPGRSGPDLSDRVFGLMLNQDWLWKAYTVLTMIVVVSNFIGFINVPNLSPSGAVLVFAVGVVLPIVAYFAPFARFALRSWGWGPLRLNLVAFFVALYGFTNLHVQEWQAIALILCYLAYLIVNWLVRDQKIEREEPSLR